MHLPNRCNQRKIHTWLKSLFEMQPRATNRTGGLKGFPKAKPSWKWTWNSLKTENFNFSHVIWRNSERCHSKMSVFIIEGKKYLKRWMMTYDSVFDIVSFFNTNESNFIGRNEEKYHSELGQRITQDLWRKVLNSHALLRHFPILNGPRKMSVSQTLSSYYAFFSEIYFKCIVRGKVTARLLLEFVHHNLRKS